MTERLRIILGVSAVFLVFHGIEEYLTGFYAIDRDFLAIAARLTINPKAAFVIEQMLLWSLLAIFYIFETDGLPLKSLLLVFSVLLFYEADHLIKAAQVQGYYPGLYTAMYLPPLGLFILWELVKSWRKN